MAQAIKRGLFGRKKGGGQAPPPDQGVDYNTIVKKRAQKGWKWQEREYDGPLRSKNTKIRGTIPPGIRDTGNKVTRRVFVDTRDRLVKKDGFITFGQKDLETTVLYENQEFNQYEVTDPGTVFYTAVRTAALDSIRQYGLNPNFGDEDKPVDMVKYNVRGFNYFGLDDNVASGYGRMAIGNGKFTILTFRMPRGTVFETDPETGGFRTEFFVGSELIQFPGDDENSIDEKAIDGNRLIDTDDAGLQGNPDEPFANISLSDVPLMGQSEQLRIFNALDAKIDPARPTADVLTPHENSLYEAIAAELD